MWVGPLQGPVGDPPWPYLHLGTSADDEAGTEALAAILERITISEPLASDPDAIAAADELLADADVCSDLERGVNVIMPDVWWTNTAFGDLAPCTYFAPDTFEIGAEGEVPDGVAITLEVVSGEVGTIEEILGFETLIVDRHAARRWELTPDFARRAPISTSSSSVTQAMPGRSWSSRSRASVPTTTSARRRSSTR